MSSFTELVAAVVVHSSAAAYAHFGVTLEPAPPDPAPTADKTVSRAPISKQDEATPCIPLRSRALKT